MIDSQSVEGDPPTCWESSGTAAASLDLIGPGDRSNHLHRVVLSEDAELVPVERRPMRLIRVRIQVRHRQDSHHLTPVRAAMSARYLASYSDAIR